MMTETVPVKYFTKAQLMLVNSAAKQQNRPKFINVDEFGGINDTHLLPVSEHSAYGNYVRATVVLNEYGHEVDIDLTFAEWDALPTKAIAATAG